ncbi:phospholipase D [Thecamonas trahens ATCC 50062]|uniref:Phospholipase D n=1 Tax=Thecamonas trahens ATCC 50062 TaxID=461836 RepID=A0A0L0DK06_THETB|nr:phospholipase D [Thecamonas trahens ATCC 50062]KNC52597.1 phospholipase D [Thecamonas trahens ATCC 50062]|eukprot:XP_013755156.1 phospholipase D [Thecamonas trahens ATCC 50062]
MAGRARHVLARFRKQYQELFSDLAPLGAISAGNSVTLYSSGSATFEAMWRAMRGARRRLWLGTYTLEPDAIGSETLSALAEAKASGVDDVILMYDAIGSLRLSQSHVQHLIDAGVRVVPFNPVWSWQWPWMWQATLRDPLIRNHRKLLIVDSDVAFAGGMNVAAEYAGPSVGGNAFFRDVHVQLRGPAVDHLATVFKDSLSEAELYAATSRGRLTPASDEAQRADSDAAADAGRKKTRPLVAPGTGGGALALPPSHGYGEAHVSTVNVDSSVSAQTKARLARFAKHVPALRNMYNRLAMYSLTLAENPVHITNAPQETPAPGDVVVQVLYSNARRGKYAIQRAMALSLLKAKSRCYMTTPYFIPPRWLTKQLIRAARRGVDVRILTAGKTDVPLYRMAAIHVYDIFLRNGIRIYELGDKALHAKTMTIDSMYASVGSFNLDLLSSHRNLEVVVSFLDPRMASALESQTLADMSSAVEITRADTSARSRTMAFAQAFVYRVLNFLFSWKG